MRTVTLPFALCLVFALGAVGCSDPDVPPVDEGAGGSPGGSGGAPAGGSGGGGGSGGVVDPGDGCDDPEDTCNAGVCPFDVVDCDTAAANFLTQCADPACALQDPSTHLCLPLEEAKSRCLANHRLSPSDNVLWSCFAQHPACGQDFTVCVIGTCQGG